MRALGFAGGLLGIALVIGITAFRAEGKPDVDKKGMVEVPKSAVRIDDGDSLDIQWDEQTVESVRILGMDTPEVMHIEHNLPYDQSFGPEARGFLRGAVAACRKLTLLRSGQTDPFGRTLGYIFVDGTNVSPLLIKARLALENVSFYGDNGLPDPAQKCVAAGKAAGPVPFEKPHLYRKRMRKLSEWLKANGKYPKPPREEK